MGYRPRSLRKPAGAASGPDEARLGREELDKQVHTYCPAFDEASLRETIRYSDHVIFNSPSQIDRFRAIIDEPPVLIRDGGIIARGYDEELYISCPPAAHDSAQRQPAHPGPGTTF